MLQTFNKAREEFEMLSRNMEDVKNTLKSDREIKIMLSDMKNTMNEEEGKRDAGEEKISWKLAL